MRIILPRHDLLGEERLTGVSEEKGISLSLKKLLLSLSCHISKKGVMVYRSHFWDHGGPFESGSSRQGDANRL